MARNDDLAQIHDLLAQHLLAALTDPEKPPRASTLQVALSYLKATSGPELGKPEPTPEDQHRDALRKTLERLKAEGKRLPFVQNPDDPDGPYIPNVGDEDGEEE